MRTLLSPAVVLALALAQTPWLDAAETRGLTPTVRAAGLDLRLDDILLTAKPAYVHVLWDAFPARTAIAAEAKRRKVKPAALRQEAVRDLVQALVPVRFPKAAKARVDLVEFPLRDAYGQPDWSSVTKLGRTEMELEPAKTVSHPATGSPAGPTPDETKAP